MSKKQLARILVIAAMIIGSALPAVATFVNSEECSLTEYPDCWTCARPWFNASFCWPVRLDGSETGRCGCADFAPYGGCVTAGEFCGIIMPSSY